MVLQIMKGTPFYHPCRGHLGEEGKEIEDKGSFTERD
jgi:hypothetical protein